MRYHWLSVLSALAAVLLADLATPLAPLWGDIRVKHTWNTVPPNWESLGPPPVGTTIVLYIALTPYHENALIDALYEVSDPKHEKYRAHLSKEQVAELVAPHQHTLEIVHSWLEHHGVPSSSISTSHGGGWLTISGVPVSQAEELFCASYQLYRHTGTNETEAILRTVGYSLPASLHAHVQTVAPTTHFAPPRKRSSREVTAMVNATSEELVRLSPRRRKREMVVPSYLRSWYKTETYEPAAMGRNVLGILGFDTGFPSQADFTRFMTKYRQDAESATFTVVELNGGVNDPTHSGEDANINTQYAAALTYPTPQIFYSTGGAFLWDLNDGRPALGDAYLSWFSYIFDEQNIPPTISILNANPESEFPPEYARVLCLLFARLGARGISVLVMSGDHGVGRGDCKDSSGNVQFIPMFPASCPWVTSVGGTMGRGNFPETAAHFSGGGFSNYFLLPEYQTSAVHAFRRLLGDKNAGYYQLEGRGIPDIAAQSDNFAYIHDGALKSASSTSCSTPVCASYLPAPPYALGHSTSSIQLTANVQLVAALVSLVNDYYLSNGKEPLGFLNLWLYTFRFKGLVDITRGSNPGCGTDGFPATTGWDPVTGLGTPGFERLLEALTQLDTPEAPPIIQH